MSATTFIIILILSFIAGILVGYFCHSFFKSSKTEQVAQIKEILLYLVAVAEKELGSGTGDLKLAKVYNEFTSEYPDLAKAITYEEFSKLVNEVLEKFKDLLNNNSRINDYIKESENK